MQSPTAPSELDDTLAVERVWLQAAAPTLRAVLRLYHAGNARYCPGRLDDRCCRFSEPTRRETAERKLCVCVKWRPNDPENMVLRIIAVWRDLQNAVLQRSLETAVSLSLSLGLLTRDYENLFFSPADVNRLAFRRSDTLFDRRFGLDWRIAERVKAVERARLAGVSLSVAWDVAAADLGCSRSTVRRAWERRNEVGMTL